MTPADLGRFVRERLPDILACVNAGLVPKSDLPDLLSALDCAMVLLTNLTFAVGDESGCAKLAVPCTCGKATKLTAAHQEAAYVVRAVLGEGGEGKP